MRFHWEEKLEAILKDGVDDIHPDYAKSIRALFSQLLDAANEETMNAARESRVAGMRRAAEVSETVTHAVEVVGEGERITEVLCMGQKQCTDAIRSEADRIEKEGK